MASGGFAWPSAEAAIGLGANRAIRSGVNSAPVRDAIIRSGEGSTYGALDKAAERAVPYSSNLLRKRERQPTKVYITKLPVSEQ